MSTNHSPTTGVWMLPFGDAFLGMDSDGVVRRVFGSVEIAPNHRLSAASLLDRPWSEIVAQHAGMSAHEGLRALWLATAGGHVAAPYWPNMVPFGPGVIARLRPVDDEPVIYAVHLSNEAGCKLDSVLGKHTLETLERAIRLGENVHRGTEGPLTDLQVRDIGAIVTHLERARQLVDDLRIELFAPTVTAPLPHPIAEFLAFPASDFASHRLITHRLRIENSLSDETVYCPPAVRDGVQHVIATLIGVIAAESAITLSDTKNDEMQAVEVGIYFRSPEPDFRVTNRVEPLALSDPARFKALSPVQSLVTSVQSRLAPVHGRAWADACPDALNLSVYHLTASALATA